MTETRERYIVPTLEQRSGTVRRLGKRRGLPNHVECRCGRQFENLAQLLDHCATAHAVKLDNAR